MINVRYHEVDPNGVRRIWIPNEVFASLVINSAHLLLPYGELWMCRLLNQSIPFVKDDSLIEDVRAFVEQEANHSKAHRLVLDAYINEGSDFSVSHRLLTKLFTSTLGAKMFGVWRLNSNWKFVWLRWKIGIVAVLEHITCVLGSWVIENTALENAGADSEMIQLLKWHGSEEIEHRCVAHDLHVHLGGTAFYRRLIFFPVFFAVVFLWIRATKRFIENSSDDNVKATFFEYLRLSKKDYVPRVSFILKSCLSYFKWGYHPSKLNQNTLNACSEFLRKYDI